MSHGAAVASTILLAAMLPAVAVPADQPETPRIGFAMAQVPATGVAKRLSISIALDRSNDYFTFDPTYAIVTLRRTDLTAPAVVLRPLSRVSAAQMSFHSVPVTPGATYRADVVLHAGSILRGAHSVRVPSIAPVAIIEVPAVAAGTAADSDVARVRAAFAAVPSVPGGFAPAEEALVLRGFAESCTSVKGAGSAGQSKGDKILFVQVTRGTASDAQNGADAVFPAYDSPATPVHVSTAPLMVSFFGVCDTAVASFANADEVLASMRPLPPDPPATHSP